MKRYLVGLLAVTLPLSFTGFETIQAEQPAISQASDTQQIIAWAQKWKRLLESGQIQKMRDMYESDAILMSNGSAPQKGVDNIISFLGRNKSAGNAVTIDFANEEIVVERDRAYLTAKYWMTIGLSNSQSINAMGRSFLVFKKSADGQWRLWRDIDNLAPDVKAEDRRR